MALTQISTQGIKDGTITGSDLATNIDLVDNQKIRFGTGNDLQIWHDGSDSNIADVGTGDLNIRGSIVNLLAGTGETFLKGVENAQVELYHNGTKELETTSNGIDVFSDNAIVNIVSNGSGTSTSFIQFRGYRTVADVGRLGEMQFINQRDGDVQAEIEVIANGDTNAYFDFKTSNAGLRTLRVDHAGANFPDSIKARFGAGEDLQIYHDGNSRIQNINNSCDFRIQSDAIELKGNSSDEMMLKGVINGAVELYHDNVQSLRTNSTGIMVQKTASGHNASVTIDATNGGQAKLELKTTLSGTNRAARIDMYNQNSLQWSIFNDYQQDGTNDFSIRHGAESAIRALTDGAVELYHDNSKKLETNSTGAKVYGSLLVDSVLDISPPGNNAVLIKNPSNGIIGFGANNQSNQVIVTTDGHLGITGDSQQLRLGASEDLQIYHDGTNSYVKNNTGVLYLQGDMIRFINDAGNENIIKAFGNGAVELNYDGVKKFETTTGGISVTGGVTCDGVTLGDNEVIQLGNSSDLKIYHDSGSNYVGSPNNQSLVFFTDNISRWFINGSGHFLPIANNAYDIGSTSNRIRNLYTNDLNLSNEGGSNDVDGTWGSYNIQEGEEDLFLVNKRNGKKYKFNLTEVS